MCNVPVTLGGGNWIAKGCLPVPAAGATCRPALKYPWRSHWAYQRDSISRGSKLLDNWAGSYSVEEVMDNYRVIRCMANRKRGDTGTWANDYFKLWRPLLDMLSPEERRVGNVCICA